MVNNLLELNERFQPFLHSSDYSFVAPAEYSQFDRFCDIASQIAPKPVFDSSIHNVLSDKATTRSALRNFRNNIGFTIYVAEPESQGTDAPSLTTIDEYCSRHQISFDC